MNITDRINSFSDWFHKEIQFVSGLDLGHRDQTYKPLLFCCLIDTISDAIPCVEIQNAQKGSLASRNGGEDKEKFLLAIRNYGKWPGCGKVSKFYLQKFLSETNDSKLDEVKKYLGKLDEFPHETIISTANDIDAQRLETHWPKNHNGAPIKFRGICFRNFTQDSLFYHFRCKLVHETRVVHPPDQLGLGEDLPSYCPVEHFTEEQNIKKEWILMYPPKFVEDLTLNILNGLVADCHRHSVDPWQRMAIERN